MNDNRKLLSKLSVGTPLYLEIDGLEERLNSFLIGICPKRFILVSVPKQAETEPNRIYPLLYSGNNMTCYTLCPGMAVAFNSHIIRFVMSPYPMLFLGYPANLELVNVRKHTRINCLFEAVLHAGQEQVHGMITDLSNGGCSFVFPSDSGAPQLGVDTPVVLESRQLAAQDDNTFKASVRSLRNTPDNKCIGLEFGSMTSSMSENLHRFISEAVRLGQA
ncbi:MAG: flagellar brake protein [Desulfovibrio sp.]|nr:flagellar brake protein [Desulfovibrio sp.]MBI4958805.1 flagellar brake protein [Desulfovibrio sp.]